MSNPLAALLISGALACSACAVRSSQAPAPPAPAAPVRVEWSLADLAQVHRRTLGGMIAILRSVAIDASSVRILTGGSSVSGTFSAAQYRDVSSRDRETLDLLGRLAVTAAGTSSCIAGLGEQARGKVAAREPPPGPSGGPQAVDPGPGICDAASMRMLFDTEVRQLEELVGRLVADLDSVRDTLEASRLIRPLATGGEIDPLKWMTERRQLYALDQFSLRARDTQNVVRRMGFALVAHGDWDDSLEAAAAAASEMIALGKEWEELQNTYDVSFFRVLATPAGAKE